MEFSVSFVAMVKASKVNYSIRKKKKIHLIIQRDKVDELLGVHCYN